MKKTIVLVFCLSTLFSFAQMSLKKLDGTPINNGDFFQFNSLADPQNYLGIKVYNSSTEDINVKVKVVSITNATGSNVQLCFGDVCVNNITAGNSYPNIAGVIPAEGSNGNFDHFLNTNTGVNTSAPIQYVFKFYQLNDSGVEIGNSVTFTYMYSAVLNTNSFVQLEDFGVKLKSSLVDNQLELDVFKNTQMSIYDLNGKMIADYSLILGNHSIDVSNLKTSVYILNFNNYEGEKVSTRFIKQ
jgi:hypothetical protein